MGDKIVTEVKFSANLGAENVIEVISFVDSIPIADKVGKEIVMHVDTEIKNDDVFYTDSNGLEL